ncbi:MAG: glucosamine-6-phosphate deaminase [Bowdeniella nasicola]|nr:glucosamine-6-phosphate deaminase [Bowdeniella nasicola]
MRVIIVKDDDAGAQLASAAIIRRFQRQPKSVLGLATGSSPLGIYQRLIAAYENGEVSFADAWAFQLDEYIGLDANHPQLYRNVIDELLAKHVDFQPGRVHAPDGLARDLASAGPAYDELIEAAGGVDVQILGIGTDGHIAFNEPGASFAAGTHVEALTEQTRTDNARFFDGDITQVPTHALTQGLGTIMRARQLIMVANGEGKAEAIAQLVEGPVSVSWPATIMQHHPHAAVIVDEAAASKLQRQDFYRHAWENRLDFQEL